LGKTNKDRTKWNSTHYQALKNTLNQFIPLIRFTEISPTEYFDNIRPYKDIIPNHICDEIEEFYFKNIKPKTISLTPRSNNRRHYIKSEIINENDERDVVPQLPTFLVRGAGGSGAKFEFFKI